MNCIDKLIDWAYENVVVDMRSTEGADEPLEDWIIGRYNGHKIEANRGEGYVSIDDTNIGFIGAWRVEIIISQLKIKNGGIGSSVDQQKSIIDLIIKYNYIVPEADIVELLEYYIGGIKFDDIPRGSYTFSNSFWGSFATDQDFAGEVMQTFMRNNKFPDWIEINLSATFNAIFKKMNKYKTQSGNIYYFFEGLSHG